MSNRDIFMSRGQKLGHFNNQGEQSAQHVEEAGTPPQPGANDRIEEILETTRQHLDIRQ